MLLWLTHAPGALRRRIVDFENYPRMVSGVNSLATYATDTKDGVITTKSFCAPPYAAQPRAPFSPVLSDLLFSSL